MDSHREIVDGDREIRRLRRLLRFGLVYNVAEGILSVGSGIVAGSVVLVGFGLDSGIEAAATFAALRFVAGEADEKNERRLAALIGWSFLALGAYVAIQSAWDLLEGERNTPSPVGVVVTSVSLVVMPILGAWKLRLARSIGSRGLQAEARETIACAYLSFFAVVGTAVRYLGGPAWVDPVAALLMVPWLVREGIEGVRGEAREEERAP